MTRFEWPGLIACMELEGPEGQSYHIDELEGPEGQSYHIEELDGPE